MGTGIKISFFAMVAIIASIWACSGATPRESEPVEVEPPVKEIERQFGVEIHLPDNLSYTYTGSFEKMESVEKVLRSICRPFELKVHKADNNQFYISK